MCKDRSRDIWAVLLLLVAVVQVVNAQPQACVNALSAADLNADSLINKTEYISLMTNLSPYQGCPVSADIERFFGLEPFSLAFEGLSCLCIQYDDLDCCSGTIKGIAVPGVYADSYTDRVCDSLYEALELECGNNPLLPTPVPTSQIIEVTEAPSTDPTSLEVKTRGSPSEDDDDKNMAKIVTPIVLGFFVFVLAIAILVKKQSELVDTTSKAAKSPDKGRLEGDVANNDPTEQTEDP